MKVKKFHIDEDERYFIRAYSCGVCDYAWGADVVYGHRWISHSSDERDHKIFESLDRMKAADTEYDQQLQALKQETIKGRETTKTVQSNSVCMHRFIWILPPEDVHIFWFEPACCVYETEMHKHRSCPFSRYRGARHCASCQPASLCSSWSGAPRSVPSSWDSPRALQS
jgi:hypothetical protein